MSDKLQSPYKLQPNPMREICFDISKQDFQDFKFRFPAHGAIDAVCASLFYHFMRAVNSQLDLPISTEIAESNSARFNQMIANLEFKF